MCTFAHVIRDFVVKTKITIWAESICGFSPFFFFFSKVLPDSDISNITFCLLYFLSFAVIEFKFLLSVMGA